MPCQVAAGVGEGGRGGRGGEDEGGGYVVDRVEAGQHEAEVGGDKKWRVGTLLPPSFLYPFPLSPKYSIPCGLRI